MWCEGAEAPHTDLGSGSASATPWLCDLGQVMLCASRTSSPCTRWRPQRLPEGAVVKRQWERMESRS